MATSPIDTVPPSLKTHSQVVPPFSVRQTPPPAVPTNQVDWRSSWTAMSVIRPIGLAGPRWRHARCSTAELSKTGGLSCARRAESVASTATTTEVGVRCMTDVWSRLRDPAYVAHGGVVGLPVVSVVTKS